jgi:hypothetical protein
MVTPCIVESLIVCECVSVLLHIRHILHSARYAAESQSKSEIFLLIKFSVALIRKNVCCLKMTELSKH